MSNVSLRTEKGGVYKLPVGIAFIEVHDGDGNLAALFHMLEAGRMTVSVPGEPTFDRYALTYKLKPSHTVKQK